MKSLIAAASSRPGQHVLDRLPATTRKKIDADLIEYIAALDGGRSVPTREQVTDFFSEEYGVTISPNTLKAWVQKVRLNGSIA